MNTISLKTQWIKTDDWRGYFQPIDAVCGANNTGDWEDSPCPTSLCKKEINAAKKILTANKIPYKLTVCETTNVFCVHVYLVTSSEDKEKAKKLLRELVDKSELLYIA